MKFVQFGKVTAGFKGYPEKVAQQIGVQHSGIDSVRGYGTPTIAQNDGYVYKVAYPDQNFHWAAVHMLVEDPDDPMGEIEWIPLGHANAVSVKEGDFIREGQIVGYEGNHGSVFSGGRRVTIQERREGSKAGTHNHQQARPVKKVKKQTRGKHYLRNKDGSAYKGEDGYYREIKHENNVSGCVDPMDYQPEVKERWHLRMLDAAAQGNTTFFFACWVVVKLLE